MIRILLVEDQEIVRRGLRTLLSSQPDLEVIGEAEQGQQALEVMERLRSHNTQPDIALMDIQMPVMDGVTATRLLTEQYPDTKIVVLTTFGGHQLVAQALRNGAKGYLLKDTPLAELADVIRSIHRGYTQFGPGILEEIIAHQTTVQPPTAEDLPPGFTNLTPREKEVLRLIAQGASNKEIASTLFLSDGTVRNHISNILRRLDLRDRTQAAIVANTFMQYLES